MSRLTSTVRQAAGAPIVQDLAAFVALSLFMAVFVYWSVVVDTLLATRRLAQ